MAAVIYRTPLCWAQHGFEDFSLHSLHTIGDGSCLIHAIAQALYKPYVEGTVDKGKLALQIRAEIADALRQPDPATGRLNYYTVAGGNLPSFAEQDAAFSLAGLESLFRSQAYLGEEMLVVVSQLLKKSIYVLDQERQDLYHAYIYPGATAVVILYGGVHFQTVALWDPKEGRFVTHFKPGRSLIRFLDARNFARKN